MTTPTDAVLALVNTTAAAHILGISKSLLEKDRSTATPMLGVPYIKLAGRVVYDPVALIDWARTKTVQPVPQPQPIASGAAGKKRGRPRKAL